MTSPKISIFTTCKNGSKYLRETLDSVLDQTFKDFEVVIVDGVSTDGSVEIIQDYASRDSRIRWISEPDKDALEGFYKAMMRTSGEYIMCLPISDFYLSKTWLQKCVEILDKDLEVSLVHGCPVEVGDDSTITGVSFPHWLVTPLPSKQEFTFYYTATFSYVSELTYCARRDVYISCFPKLPENPNLQFEMIGRDSLTDEVFDPFLGFLINFFSRGYLAQYVPCLATAGRTHNNSRNKKFEKYLRLVGEKYCSELVKLREKVVLKSFVFLDGKSNPLPPKNLDGRSAILDYRINSKLMFNAKETFPVRVLIKINRVLSAIHPRSALFPRYQFIFSRFSIFR